MGADMFDQYGEFKRQLPDRDPAETEDWVDSLDNLAQNDGADRAQFILYRLLKRARSEGVVEIRTPTASMKLVAGQETLVSGQTIAAPKDVDLLERIKRGFQRAGKDLDRAFRGP